MEEISAAVGASGIDLRAGKGGDGGMSKKMGADRERWKKRMDMSLSDRNLTMEGMEIAIEDLENDRNRWKIRAEALERAIKAHKGNEEVLCAACFMCIRACAAGVTCHGNNDSWQFDADRFRCVS